MMYLKKSAREIGDFQEEIHRREIITTRRRLPDEQMTGAVVGRMDGGFCHLRPRWTQIIGTCRRREMYERHHFAIKVGD